MNSNITDIQKKLQPLFQKEKGVLFVYLFGSQALGRVDFESDVDLAMYFDKRKINDFFKKRLFLIGEIQAILKRPVEVVVLNETKSTFLKFVIIKEGKVIFERDLSMRVDFELKTMQEYYDFAPFIKEYNKAYLEKSFQK